jgi:ArsR family transcriptional regulator, lead/cadmium/zinc/bismuth-responsive transcriptional repressor
MKQENTNSRKSTKPTCEHDHNHKPEVTPVEPAALERASSLFRALGDTARLQILVHLNQGECCVSEVVEAMGEKFSTISQRLRILRSEGLINRRRVGLHVFYSLADGHVAQLLANALEHAGELNAKSTKGSGPDLEENE